MEVLYLLNKYIKYGLLLSFFSIFYSNSMQLPDDVVWVEVKDEASNTSIIIPLSKMEVNQMDVLRAFVEEDKDKKNSSLKPFDLTAIEIKKEDGTTEIISLTKKELDLLTIAIDGLYNGTFKEYFKSLSRNDMTLLINAAHKMGVNYISALIVSFIIPQGPQQEYMILPFIDPIVKYCTSGKMFKLLNVKTSASYAQQVLLKRFSLGNIYAVAYSPDNKHIVTGSDSGMFIVWDALANHIKSYQMFKDFSIVCVAWSPDGNNIALSVTDINNINILIVCEVDSEGNILNKDEISITSDIVRSISFSPDSKYLVAGGDGKENIVVWNVDNYEKVKQLEGYKGSIYGITYSPDGTKIISCGSYGDKVLAESESNVIEWDAQTGKIAQYYLVNATAEEHKSLKEKEYYCVMYSSDGKKLALGFEQGCIILDALTTDVTKIITNKETVVSVAWSKDGEWLVCGTNASPQGNPFVCKMSNQRDTINKIYFNGHRNTQYGKAWVRSVAVSSNSKYIVSGATNGDQLSNLIVWPILNKIEINALYKLNVPQAKLLFQIYTAKINGSSLDIVEGAPEYDIFDTLPDIVKNIIFRFFWSESCDPEKEEGCALF